MITWLIGMAGAGKTTTGRQVYQRLKERNPATVFLDGDHLRVIMGEDVGHSVEDRRRNGWRMVRMCEYFDGEGLDVVCCVLSLFHDQQEWNREHLSDYFEVFLDVPYEELRRRDQKGLYSQAEAGWITDVVGVDIPFEPPVRPDLVLPFRPGPDGRPEAQAKTILRELDARRKAVR